MPKNETITMNLKGKLDEIEEKKMCFRDEIIFFFSFDPV